MKKRFRLIIRQLKTFIGEGTFYEAKSLYHAILISRTLYASEAWSTATYNVDRYGRIGQLYNRDGHGQDVFPQPSYTKTSKESYLKWFGTKTIANDIRRLKKKKKIKTFHDIPMLPSQIAILKDLSLIFDILDPRTGMSIEEFLEPPSDGARVTRARLVSIMEKATQDPTTNDQHRNLFRRHEGILRWMYQSNYLLPLLEMRKKPRRKMIGLLLGTIRSEENRLREEIFQGNFSYQRQNRD